LKIKIFFGLAIIALIGLAGCNINPSNEYMKLDVSTQSEEDLVSRGYSIHTRYAWYWGPEVINAYVKNINPYDYIYVKLEISDSMDGPWGPIPGTPSTYMRLSYNQSYSKWFMSECARLKIFASSSSDFTYYFQYDY
jgi:hypothetical protein